MQGEPTEKRVRHMVTECPVCESSLYVSELSCSACQTRLSGAFDRPPLARLPAEQQEFILTFVRCRGIIRDVERVMGISYPTVRARLDAVARALDTLTTVASPTLVPPIPPVPPALPRRSSHTDAARRALLEQVAHGHLDPSEAAEALRRL